MKGSPRQRAEMTEELYSNPGFPLPYGAPPRSVS